jgi:hypothetical protein
MFLFLLLFCLAKESRREIGCAGSQQRQLYYKSERMIVPRWP